MTSGKFDGNICYSLSSTPEAYENGLVMNYTGGMCGFKFQVTNNNENGFSSKFKVMKDGATQVTCYGATLLAAVYALFF